MLTILSLGISVIPLALCVPSWMYGRQRMQKCYHMKLVQRKLPVKLKQTSSKVEANFEQSWANIKPCSSKLKWTLLEVSVNFKRARLKFECSFNKLWGSCFCGKHFYSPINSLGRTVSKMKWNHGWTLKENEWPNFAWTFKVHHVQALQVNMFLMCLCIFWCLMWVCNIHSVLPMYV